MGSTSKEEYIRRLTIAVRDRDAALAAQVAAEGERNLAAKALGRMHDESNKLEAERDQLRARVEELEGHASKMFQALRRCEKWMSRAWDWMCGSLSDFEKQDWVAAQSEVMQAASADAVNAIKGGPSKALALREAKEAVVAAAKAWAQLDSGHTDNLGLLSSVRALAELEAQP